jgi:hypothetical protein
MYGYPTQAFFEAIGGEASPRATVPVVAGATAAVDTPLNARVRWLSSSVLGPPQATIPGGLGPLIRDFVLAGNGMISLPYRETLSASIQPTISLFSEPATSVQSSTYDLMRFEKVIMELSAAMHRNAQQLEEVATRVGGPVCMRKSELNIYVC